MSMEKIWLNRKKIKKNLDKQKSEVFFRKKAHSNCTKSGASVVG